MIFTISFLSLLTKFSKTDTSASHKQLIFIVAIQEQTNNHRSQLDLVHENRKKEQGLSICYLKKILIFKLSFSLNSKV